MRAFQYFASGKYVKDLKTQLFPRMLFIAPSEARLKVLVRELSQARDNYKGPYASLVHTCPFWLATYHDIDIASVDEWRLSSALLEHNWKTIEGETGVSPFERDAG